VALNLVNLEAVSKAYGLRTLLDDVSLGVADSERIGVVGRNGSGKTTLLRVLARLEPPDSGRVTHAGGLRVALLTQGDDLDPAATVRQVVLGERAEHDWAGDARVRDILTGLFGGLDLAGLPAGLDSPIGPLSGGERRRVALARELVRPADQARSDLLVLDEPTNHLDVEGIAWLAGHLATRRGALVVVTHDRWFLDAVCTRTWEVVGGEVAAYDGGYAPYVLAKAERSRVAAAEESRRQNLMRKELAWLRRGPPARTSKPRFRIDAANALIADEPPARDPMELVRFATARLGRTVYELHDVTLLAGGKPAAGTETTAASDRTAASGRTAGSDRTAGSEGTAGSEDTGTSRAANPAGLGAPARALLDRVSWNLGPGQRVGIVGVNGSGKTSLMRLLLGEVAPAAGTVTRGLTIRVGHLSQEIRDPEPGLRVLEAVEREARSLTVGKREFTASALAEKFGFTGERQWTPVANLSGGERRRLQLLRLLMAAPNVLLLDEPTNDLDIETLTQLEDLLDGWPGSLLVVSHDRYFLERTTDQVFALLGDGSLRMLPLGVDEYLERRREAVGRSAATASTRRASAPSATAPGAPSSTSAAITSSTSAATSPDTPQAPSGVTAAEARAARKELTRIERRLERITTAEKVLHEQLAQHATDYARVAELDGQLRELAAERAQLEEQWLETAEAAEG
jgi:ATP-binding cassette subfamily F protein uup